MANTVEHGNGFLRLILDSDFVFSTATITAGKNTGMIVGDCYPVGLALTGVKFEPSAANDVLKVRDGALTGPIRVNMTAITGDALKDTFLGNKLVKPYVEYDDLTLNTAANATIWLEFENVAHI